MKFDIVSGRCGVEMDTPVMFATRAESVKYVRENIAERLKIECGYEMKEAGIDTDNVDEVLRWGWNNDYCESYNCVDDNGNEVIDTATVGNDWTEFKITEMDTDMLKKKDVPLQPVFTATDIRWDVDIDEGFDKLDDMSSDKAAEYLGVPKEAYANMTTSERHDYAYDAWHHNRKSLSEFVGAPNEVALPADILWDEDSISDYLCDEYGWYHEGFRITCNYSIEEMEARIKDICDGLDGLMTDSAQTEIEELENAITLMKNEEKGWSIPEFFKEDDDDLLR